MVRGLNDAKNKLAELFTRASLAETVIITREGENQGIRLIPVPRPHPVSGFGMLRDQLADCLLIGTLRKNKRSSWNKFKRSRSSGFRLEGSEAKAGFRMGETAGTGTVFAIADKTVR